MLKLLLIAGLFLFQAPQGDDPEANRPPSCDNYAKSVHKCQCGRALHADCGTPEPKVAMDKSCLTYCKEQNCKCHGACVTMKMSPCETKNG